MRGFFLPVNLDVAQFGRVVALEASGHRFKSCHPDQICNRKVCCITARVENVTADGSEAFV